MLNRRPSVAVITPTKNRLELLCEAMDSVQAQVCDDWEHIVDCVPSQDPAQEPDGYGGWLEMLDGVVELKPNVFGLGFNLNAAFREFARSRQRSRQSIVARLRRWRPGPNRE